MLGNLLKKKIEPGLASIGVHPDGVSMVMAERSNPAVPQITAWEFRPWTAGQALDDVVASLAKDYRLNRRHCITLLDPSEYRVLVADAPDVPPDELREAIRWRVKDLLDFDINHAAIDLFDFPAPIQIVGNRSRYVVAAQNQAVARHINLMEKAGINLEIVDIPEMALRNIAALVPDNQHGVAMLYLTDNFGLLTLTKGNVLYVSRTLNVGLDELIEADERRDMLETIVREVQRSLDYFASHFSQPPIAQLALTPLPDTLPGLDEYFSQQLGMAVSIIDIGRMVDWGREIDDQMALKCLTTFGAALRALH